MTMTMPSAEVPGHGKDLARTLLIAHLNRTYEVYNRSNIGAPLVSEEIL